MHRFSAFWLKSIIMAPLRSRDGAKAYCGGHLAAQLVTDTLNVSCAQLIRDLFAIAKFYFTVGLMLYRSTVMQFLYT